MNQPRDTIDVIMTTIQNSVLRIVIKQNYDNKVFTKIRIVSYWKLLYYRYIVISFAAADPWTRVIKVLRDKNACKKDSRGFKNKCFKILNQLWWTRWKNIKKKKMLKEHTKCIMYASAEIPLITVYNITCAERNTDERYPYAKTCWNTIECREQPAEFVQQQRCIIKIKWPLHSRDYCLKKSHHVSRTNRPYTYISIDTTNTRQLRSQDFYTEIASKTNSNKNDFFIDHFINNYYTW